MSAMLMHGFFLYVEKKEGNCIIINHNKLMTDRCTDNGFEEGQECYIKKILEKEKI